MEIANTKEELSDGMMLTSQALEREYARSVGYIEGLKFIQTLLDELKEEAIDEDEQRETT